MNRISKHDEQSSDMYVTQDGEIGGKVPEELYGLASKETIVDYVKGMVLVALLLGGASYMKQQAQQKAQKHLQELPAEQRAKLEQARETYGGPGM